MSRLAVSTPRLSKLHRLVRFLSAFAWRTERADTAILEYIQVSPNPRLSLLTEYWVHKEITLRGAARRLMHERPNAGFEAHPHAQPNQYPPQRST